MDPLHAAPYVDNPALRYSRILYPIVVHALSLGDSAVIPYMLPIVNGLAMVAGTLGLAFWLRRRSLSVWLALVFGLFPGLFDAFRHDLTEPLPYALLIWGIVALGWRRPAPRYIGASVCFALAMLGREETLLVSFPYIVRLAWPEIRQLHLLVWSAVRRGVIRAGSVLVASVAPFLMWSAIISKPFGAVASGRVLSQFLPFRLPLSGIFTYWTQLNTAEYPTLLLFVAAPGTIAAIAAIAALFRWPQGWRPATWALALNALYLCVFLAANSYDFYISTGRIQSGIVLSAVLALPTLDGLWRQRRGWFWAANALWLAPLWMIAIYPSVNVLLVLWHIIPS